MKESDSGRSFSQRVGGGVDFNRLRRFFLTSLAAGLALYAWASAAAEFQHRASSVLERAAGEALSPVGSIPRDACFIPASKHPFGQPDVAPRLAKGMFLVASKGLIDPNFRRSVVLVVAHDEEGAMGVIVNRPTKLTLSSVLPDIDGLAERSDQLFLGGPVATSQITLLFRATGPPKNSLHVFSDVYFSGSLTTLMDYLQDHQLARTMHAYAGYAGWAPGQLEGEVDRGDWNLVSADAEIVFSESPEDMWPKLIREASGLWVRGAQRDRVRHAGVAQLPVTFRK